MYEDHITEGDSELRRLLGDLLKLSFGHLAVNRRADPVHERTEEVGGNVWGCEDLVCSCREPDLRSPLSGLEQVDRTGLLRVLASILLELCLLGDASLFELQRFEFLVIFVD